MIFKDWRAILSGTKTTDLRLMHDGEYIGKWLGKAWMETVVYRKGHYVKYMVGNTYAVQPRANHPALIYHPNQRGIDIVEPDDNHYRYIKEGAWNPSGQGYITARIRITAIEKVTWEIFYAWQLTFELVKGD